MAQPVGQVLATIGHIPLDGGFPERPVEFVHDLHLDTRLTHAAVADLADRLPLRSVIYDTAAQPLLVPQGGPPRGALARPGDVIRNLSTANAWLTLLNVEDDAGCAELMNTMLNQLEHGMIGLRGKMRNRVAFVFVSSPNSVTPVHFDIEHSLLMQVRGSKTVSIGRFESDTVQRHEINRYWDGSHGRIEALPQEVATHVLTPGRGLYIPSGTPHWVHNGPDISMSVDPHVLHCRHGSRKPHRGLQLARSADAPEPTGTRAFRHSRHRQDLRHGRLGHWKTLLVRGRRHDAPRRRNLC